MNKNIDKAYRGTYWAHNADIPAHIIQNRKDIAQKWGLRPMTPGFSLTVRVRQAICEKLDHVEWYKTDSGKVGLLFHEYDTRPASRARWEGLGFHALPPLYSDDCASYSMFALDLATISRLLAAVLMDDYEPMLRWQKRTGASCR